MTDLSLEEVLRDRESIFNMLGSELQEMAACDRRSHLPPSAMFADFQADDLSLLSAAVR